MARRARVVVEGGLYHVYNRISSGEGVFADPDEASAFIEIIRDVKKKMRAPLVDVDEMLLCFGTTQKTARQQYLRAIRAGIDPGSAGTDSPRENLLWTS